MDFIIIWTKTRLKRKPRGYVADYCPVCHAVRPFALIAIHAVEAFYRLVVVEDTLLGYEIECHFCRSTFDVGMYEYRHTEPDPGSDVDALVRQTNPRLYEHEQESLEAADRLHAGTLTPDEREHLVLSPFVMVRPAIEAHYADGALRARVLRPLIIGVVLAVLMLLLSAWMEKAVFVSAWKLALLVLGVGCVFAMHVRRSDLREFVRTRVVDKLAQSLAPLRPRIDELVPILEYFQGRGERIARVLSADQLYAAVVDPPAHRRPLPGMIRADVEETRLLAEVVKAGRARTRV